MMSIRTYAARTAHVLWAFTERRIVMRGVVVIASIAVAVVALPLVTDLTAHIAYNGNNFANAQRLWRANAHIAWHNQDIPTANAGLAYYRAGHLTPAVDQMERALRLTVPARECRIRWNLALALYQRGDQRVAEQQLNDAVGDYARAINVLDWQSCLDDPEYSEQFQQLSEALTQKIEALIARINEQHQRPTDTEEEQQGDSDDNATGDQTKAQKQREEIIRYQNSTNDERERAQDPEQRLQKYQYKAW